MKITVDNLIQIQVPFASVENEEHVYINGPMVTLSGGTKGFTLTHTYCGNQSFGLCFGNLEEYEEFIEAVATAVVQFKALGCKTKEDFKKFEGDSVKLASLRKG